MFRNYLVTALRNIVRHKLYSFINIAGLAVGLACVIFIILFVRDQLSYDRWIPGTENVYRLEIGINLPGKPVLRRSTLPFVATQAMLDQIPEVEARTRLTRRMMTILVGNQQFPQRVDAVDPNFLQLIRLPLVMGYPASVFAKPDSVVLSERSARKYFRNELPIGKTLVISTQHCDAAFQNCEEKRYPLVVSGILRNLPHNTQFEADVMIPNTSPASPVTDEMRTNWLGLYGWGYVRLSPGADPNAVLQKFKAVVDRSVDPMKQMNIKKRGSQLLSFFFTPLAEDHLSTDRFGSMTPPGSWTAVYGFGAIGAMILLIACFNFTNLATARAMMRAREISLRKVVGAKRRQLTIQFLSEAWITAMIALVCAMALVEMLSPLFGRVLGLPIEIHYFSQWRLLLAILGVGSLAGLLSGAYPALVLSGFRPAASLRAQHGGLAAAGHLRTLLVVLQFAVSIGLGIAVSVIFSQVSFSQNVDLGFRKDAIVIANIASISSAAADSMARALRKDPDILDVATSDDVPLTGGHNHISAHVPGATSTDNLILVGASPDYMTLYGIRLLAGRLLSEDRALDGLAPEQVTSGQPFNILINASAARRLGYSPQQAIGKTMALVGWLHNSVTIVGVVADTKQDGPKSAAEGTIYMYRRSFPVGYLSIRVRGGHMARALTFIDKTWHAFAPTVAIQRHFLDDDYDQQFQSDEHQGVLFGVFVGIAIFIACLGLFGLAAYSTERRTKEVGLRKAFGAETRDIIWMLLKQFSVPVLVANVIAWPVAWYYLHGWLQGFAYRIPLNPLYFIGAGAVALAIAWATIFIHAWRVAMANPIHALRYE